ncbi:MAG: radical protein [Proteobacteria bacterium]|nr:radical protein [Pseudomonadota bacterium]
MKIIHLKEHPSFIEAYVNLRNHHAKALYSSVMSVEETKIWLETKDVEVLIALENETLLGVGILYAHKEGEVTVFVAKPNQGIATKLLEAIKERGKDRKFSHLWAWVADENEASQRVFTKNGFIFLRSETKTVHDVAHQGAIFQYGLTMQKIEHTKEHYGIRDEAVAFPMMIVLSFSYVCNALCPNCPYTNSTIRADYKDAKYMSEAIFKKIADEAGQFGAWLRISGGGEPLMHPQFLELMRYAKEKGCKLGIINNGSLMSIDKAKALFEMGVEMLEFSVDASTEHDYDIVRKGLSFEKLVSQLRAVYALRNEMGAKTKIIASAINQQGIDVDAVEQFWQPYVDQFQKRKYLTWGINDPQNSADETPYLPPEEKIPCPFIFERLNIDSRGQVMVCGYDIAAHTNMGNITEKSIQEIWHGEGFDFYRQKHLARKGDEIAMCKECPDWKYRSWHHNYWKLVENAEISKNKTLHVEG